MKYLLLSLSLLLIGCGDTKVINGVEYDTFGFVDEKQKRNENIEYEIIVGNVVWSIILSETILAPIYFVGWSLYEPIGVLNKNKIKGSIN